MSHTPPLPPPTTLGIWHSPDLFELLYRTNHISSNTYAEALLKTIGYEMSREGSTKAGLQTIYQYWADKGVDLHGARLVDGSGLSPVNRISPGQLSGLLNKMAGEKEFPVFLNTLPLAGYSGSLARHFHGSSAEGLLRAKSGFLSNTIAYAGYTPMENGHLAAFVIIVNDYQGTSANMRQKILELMNSIRSHN
jgi:serine-type D-Ala-D-Ala carboxypeptidase/endopeptidase (penicillin-binding protein 4)